MTRVTTIIFDMYETLVHNEHTFWHQTFDDIIAQQGLKVEREDLWKAWREHEVRFRDDRVLPGAAFKNYYKAWQESFEHAFAALKLAGNATAATDKAMRDVSQRPPYPETHAALNQVQGRWRTAICSNADDQYLLPNLKLLGRQFDMVVSSEEARSYKPQPELFREALRRLKVSPEEAIYVGDRQLEDVQGSHGVGMRCVWVNRAGKPVDPRLPAPDYQARSLLELPALIESICQPE